MNDRDVRMPTDSEAQAYASLPVVNLTREQYDVVKHRVAEMVESAYILSDTYPDLAEAIRGVVSVEVIRFLTGHTPRPWESFWNAVMTEDAKNKGTGLKDLLLRYPLLNIAEISQGTPGYYGQRLVVRPGPRQFVKMKSEVFKAERDDADDGGLRFVVDPNTGDIRFDPNSGTPV